MELWIWIILGVAIVMIVSAIIGFAVTSSGGWRWALIIIGILLLIAGIAAALLRMGGKQFTEFANTPGGQSMMKMAML